MKSGFMDGVGILTNKDGESKEVLMRKNIQVCDISGKIIEHYETHTFI